MKTTRTIEVAVCDLCGTADAGYYRCLGCHKDVCFDCAKSAKAKTFSAGVYFSGSGDGVFCIPCLTAPPPAITELLAAYRDVDSLRAYLKAQDVENRVRVEAAESSLKALLSAREG